MDPKREDGDCCRPMSRTRRTFDGTRVPRRGGRMHPAEIDRWSEATVVPEWSGETQGGSLGVMKDYFIPMLIGRDSSDVEGIAGAMEGIVDNPFTKAAVEMALLDVIAKGSNGTLEHAAEYLAGMKKQKRYQRDVY